MRGRVSIALLVVTASVISAPGDGLGGTTTDFPTCRLALEKGQAAHVVRFRARCEYELREISIFSDEELAAVDERVSLSGPVDPEDRFACDLVSGTANCHGRAGEDVRTAGRFQTKEKACKTWLNMDVSGGPDCEPGQACIDVVYLGHREVRHPKGC